MTQCGEPHPSLTGVSCDKDEPCYVFHESQEAGEVWDGVALPGRGSRRTEAARIASSVRSTHRVGPPQIELGGHRGGSTYEEAFDYDRLNDQARRVFDVMATSGWRTLSSIAAETGDPEASVSARLRDLRKPEYGALKVERRRVRDRKVQGVWEYRLLDAPRVDHGLDHWFERR